MYYTHQIVETGAWIGGKGGDFQKNKWASEIRPFFFIYI
jgi:hypothetical protein